MAVLVHADGLSIGQILEKRLLKINFTENIIVCYTISKKNAGISE